MLNIHEKDQRLEDVAKIGVICRANCCPVKILGGGAYGEVIATYLADHGLKNDIQFVVDDEYFTPKDRDAGRQTFSEYLKGDAGKSPLVFGIYNYEIIQEKRRKYSKLIPNMFDFHVTSVNHSIVDWNYEYVKDHLDEFNETYELLSDDLSKGTMQAYINAAVSGEFHELFTHFREPIQYFGNNLCKSLIDCLFDCGAYDGDSAHEFIKAFPNYTYIYEFEPDEANVKKIRERVLREDIRDLTIVEKGVWSETKRLSFTGEGSTSSFVSDEGEFNVEVVKLDDFYDKVTDFSLIKMDIEGSELEALKGAKKIIEKRHPALAICVYHKREDLITIPQYINRLVPSDTYDYYLGYHGMDLAELVFYAVPKERTSGK